MIKTIASRFGLTLALAVVCVLPGEQALAAGKGGVKIGMLTCKKIPGSTVNLLIHSSTGLDCVYHSEGGAVVEKYKGESGVALGVDLSWDKVSVMKFAVISPSKNVDVGNYALAGTYTGATASAALGLGVGAKVLVGGGPESIALNPVALEGIKGVGAAAGIGYLTLQPAR